MAFCYSSMKKKYSKNNITGSAFFKIIIFLRKTFLKFPTAQIGQGNTFSAETITVFNLTFN